MVDFIVNNQPMVECKVDVLRKLKLKLVYQCLVDTLNFDYKLGIWSCNICHHLSCPVNSAAKFLLFAVDSLGCFLAYIYPLSFVVMQYLNSYCGGCGCCYKYHIQ